LIEEAHSWGRRNGQRQPEVVIENIWQKLVYLVLPGQWISIDQARYIAAWYGCPPIESNFTPARRQPSSG
jgi:hypothetical protein